MNQPQTVHERQRLTASPHQTNVPVSGWDPATCSGWILGLKLGGKEAIARTVIAEEIDGETLLNLDRISEVKAVWGIPAGMASKLWAAIQELKRSEVRSAARAQAPFVNARVHRVDSGSRLRTYSKARHVHVDDGDILNCWGMCARHQVQVFNAEEAELQRDTDAVDCPEYRLVKFASWLLKPAWAPLVLGTWTIMVGFSLLLMTVWYEGLSPGECPSGCDEQKKLLQWIFTACMVTSAVLVANAMHSFRDALIEQPPGALATLAWENPDRKTGRVKISEEDKQWLDITAKWWTILCCALVPAIFANMCKNLLMEQFIWPELHDWTAQSYFYWISMNVFMMFMSVLTAAIMVSLHAAAVLTRDAVLEVLKKIQGVSADGDEWVAVEADILSLASHTMPCVSDGYAQVVVVTFGVCWIGTLGVFANYLAHPTWGHMVLNLVSLLPFCVAWPLARTSDYCDKLMTVLNTKRVLNLAENDLAAQIQVNNHLTALETALTRQNNGKGLGFVAFGVVINKRALSQMFVVVSSGVSTVLPLIMLLQPRATNDYVVDCGIDEAQAASLQLFGQLLRVTTFANSTCVYNITLDDILSMAPGET